jgi:hypothetical protein
VRPRPRARHRPVRTIADLARIVSPELLEEAVDDVLCRRLSTLDGLAAYRSLRRVVAAMERRRRAGAQPGGVAAVRTLLAAGVPSPQRQRWIAAACARVDLAYPAERVAIELDSFRWHAGRRAFFTTNRARGSRTVAAGWHLLRAVPGDIPPTVAAARRSSR